MSYTDFWASYFSSFKQSYFVCFFIKCPSFCILYSNIYYDWWSIGKIDWASLFSSSTFDCCGPVDHMIPEHDAESDAIRRGGWEGRAERTSQLSEGGGNQFGLQRAGRVKIGSYSDSPGGFVSSTYWFRFDTSHVIRGTYIRLGYLYS